MATKGNTQVQKGIPDIQDAFVVIVKTEWNAEIVNKLEKSARSLLKQKHIRVATLTVPGAFEIPFTVKQHYTYAKQVPDAYITFGAVIRGGTPHFEYVCQAVTEGVVLLNQQLDVPVIFGVLTVDNPAQAKERTGGSEGDKGEEAAITAIKMIALNRKLQ